MIHLWPWAFSIILSLIFIWIPEVPLGQDGPQHLFMGHLFSLGPETFKAYIFPQSLSPYQAFSRIISFFPDPIIQKVPGRVWISNLKNVFMF